MVDRTAGLLGTPGRPLFCPHRSAIQSTSKKTYCSASGGLRKTQHSADSWFQLVLVVRLRRKRQKNDVWQKNVGQNNRRLYASIGRPFYCLQIFLPIQPRSEPRLNHAGRSPLVVRNYSHRWLGDPTDKNGHVDSNSEFVLHPWDCPAIRGIEFVGGL
jgi:hypothetical protein